jgi:ElaA protein
VTTVTSPSDRDRAYEVRRRVFVDEQNFPIEDEFDDDDEAAVHVLAEVGAAAVGTGRLVLRPQYARIGRMAVLPPYRGQGIGQLLLDRLLLLASQRRRFQIVLHAQLHAIPFYEASGFQVVSEVFDEAGSPHRRMERQL